jgi:hypothetical protein
MFRAAKRVEVPWRLYSWLKPVSALPLGSRIQPCARSKAWMAVFHRWQRWAHSGEDWDKDQQCRQPCAQTPGQWKCTNCGAVPIRCLVGAKCARLDRRKHRPDAGQSAAHSSAHSLPVGFYQGAPTPVWLSLHHIWPAFHCAARLQSSDSVTQKPPAPLADRHLGNAQTFANLTSTATFCRLENNLTPYLSRCSTRCARLQPSNSLRSSA